jgi:hypothetical protein
MRTAALPTRAGVHAKAAVGGLLAVHRGKDVIVTGW